MQSAQPERGLAGHFWYSVVLCWCWLFCKTYKCEISTELGMSIGLLAVNIGLLLVNGYFYGVNFR